MSSVTSAAALTRSILTKPCKPGQAHWRALRKAADGLKAIASDSDEKNRLWFLSTFAAATVTYLNAYRQLTRREYLEGWCILENAEIGLANLVRNSFVPELAPLVKDRTDLIAKWQDLFPYKHFISPAMRYTRWACSICDKQSSPVDPCGHLQGHVYDGQLCYRLVHEAEPLHIAIVTDPVQKYSVLQLDYDYDVVDFVLAHLRPLSPLEGTLDAQAHRPFELPRSANERSVPLQLWHEVRRVLLTKGRG